MVTKMEKLLAKRSRIIGDFKHHMEIIDGFNDDTDPVIITYRKRALIKSYDKLNENWETIEDTNDTKNEV